MFLTRNRAISSLHSFSWRLAPGGIPEMDPGIPRGQSDAEPPQSKTFGDFQSALRFAKRFGLRRFRAAY